MRMDSLKKTSFLFASLTIGLIGLSLPASAQDAAPGSSSTAPAVSPQDPLCRAVNRSTPVFESNSTISSALRLIPPDGLVRMTEVPAAGSQFARINEPVSGYIQTAVLKSCSTTPPPRTACRYLKQPDVVNVRREPAVNASNVVGAVYRNEKIAVILDQNGNVSSKTADGYTWVELDMTKAPFNRPNGGTGWIYNSVVGSSQSNLGYCQ